MCVYLYFDEEVVGGFREVGYSLLVFVNKFLWEYLEKVMCMEVIIWRMVGLVGFEFVIFGLEGWCFILLGYGFFGENLRGVFIKVMVGGNKRREGSYFFFLRRSGIIVRLMRVVGL